MIRLHCHSFDKVRSVQLVPPAINFDSWNFRGSPGMMEKLVEESKTKTSVVKECSTCGALREYLFLGDHVREFSNGKKEEKEG
jgi:hypothetical protein